MISCNTSIIGTVTIGDGAIIGANFPIIADVPAGANGRTRPEFTRNAWGMSPRQRCPETNDVDGAARGENSALVLN
jgi:bifunctional N-acetylglucosamine-1-phosphate-uridyltransferase/glucosamine-1-phosphate-acetyltransferase GlmU-like protein